MVGHDDGDHEGAGGGERLHRRAGRRGADVDHGGTRAPEPRPVPGRSSATQRLPPASPAAVARRAVLAANGAIARIEAQVAPLATAIDAGDYAESGRLAFEIRSALRRARTGLDDAGPAPGREDARARIEALAVEVEPVLRAAPVLEEAGAGSAAAEQAWRERRARPAAHAPDAIAQAARELDAAQALADRIDEALAGAADPAAGAAAVDADVERLAALLYMAKNLALSDPTLPEGRKRELPALLARIERLEAEVIRFQHDHHGSSMLAHATGAAVPAAAVAAPAASQVDVATVDGMIETLAAAMHAAAAHDRTRARGLHRMVAERYTAIRDTKDAEPRLRALGSARTQFEQRLELASTALIDFRQEVYRGRSERMLRLAFEQFALQREAMRLVAGEVDAASSRQAAQVRAAADANLAIIAIATAAPLLGPEVLMWALMNPGSAVAAADIAVSVGPQILEAGGIREFFLGVVSDPARLADFAAALGSYYVDGTANRSRGRGTLSAIPVDNAASPTSTRGGASATPGDDPAHAGSPRGAPAAAPADDAGHTAGGGARSAAPADDVVAPLPVARARAVPSVDADGTHGTHGTLPPEIDAVADQPGASGGSRARRAAGDAVDHVGAAVDATVAWATGKRVDVAPDRSRTGAPRERAPFREHRDAALHRRLKTRAERAAAADDAEHHGHYEGTGGEIAAITGELRRRGGRIAYQVADPFTGDVWTAVELRNGRRVNLMSRGTAGPRVRRPGDKRRAAKLRAQAKAAAARLDARDTAAATATAALPRDDRGNVLHLWDHVTVGAGTAATINHASGGSTRGMAVAERSAAQADPLRIVNLAEAPEPWRTRDVDLGQPSDELAAPAWAAQHAELATAPETYTHSRTHADVLALTADRAGVGTVYGYRVIDTRSGAFDDVVPGARVELTVRRLATGTVERWYARRADHTAGPGPSRRLDPKQLGGAGAAAEARETQLVDSGRLLYAEAGLATPPTGNVLVSGGSATAPWIARKVIAGGGRVTWIARRRGDGQLPVNPTAAVEVARLRAELRADDLSPERRAYLQHRLDEAGAFGDADLARNHDAFAEPAIARRVAEIRDVTPSEDLGGAPGQVQVTLDDGTVELYDAVVIAHGPDPSSPDAGGPVAATRGLGKLTPHFAEGDLVSLESADGAVRVLGSAIWSQGWSGNDQTPARIVPTRLKAWTRARSTQASTLPPFSRGVNDSIAMANHTISKANASTGDEQ
jgi:hypothetical protein